MAIPGETHPGWLKAISGQAAQNMEFLATKLLLGRLNQSYKRDASPANLKQCVAELRAFFEKNQNLPKVQGDLKKIIEGR
jgi:hypothetical protein